MEAFAPARLVAAPLGGTRSSARRSPQPKTHGDLSRSIMLPASAMVSEVTVGRTGGHGAPRKRAPGGGALGFRRTCRQRCDPLARRSLSLRHLHRRRLALT